MVPAQIVRVLIHVFFIFFIFEQVWCQNIRFEGTDNAEGICPSATRCRERNRCRPSSLKLIRGQPTLCGFSSRRRPKICCPDQTFKPEPPPPTIPPEPESFSPMPRPPIPGDCGNSFGQPSREWFVTGGENAEQGAWPWMVAIMQANRRGVQTPLCTGYLIDKRHVITAAHCFDSKQVSLYSTRIGHVNLTRGDVYPISRIAVHEGYRKGQFYDDIALLTLTKDVDVPNFSPICLPSPGFFQNLTGRGTTVVGWGATRSNGPMSLIQKQLSAMPVVSNEQCDRAFRQKLTSFARQFDRGISKGMMCAGFLDEPGKDSCGGDSGGPLMIQEQDKWFAVGVVSFGYLCGQKDIPGGYTRVTEHLPWIEKNKS